MKKIEGLTKSATSVTVAVFISRILGLVREQVLAYFFGAGKIMDAYVVAYRIPNLLRDLFAEGALGSAFVKVFSSTLEKEGPEKSFKVAQTILSNLLIILGTVVIAGVLAAPWIVGFIAPEFTKDPEKFGLTVRLTQIMMPFLLFISLSSVLAGMLNSFRVFFLPAFSSSIFNVASVLVGVLGYFLCVSINLNPIYAMAVGVSLGGFLQFYFQYPEVKKRGFFFTFSPDFKDPSFREVLRLILPVILGLSAVQINIFINTFFATSCGEGAVSWYSYAFRIMYVPLGLFGVGLSQALLPELSRAVARKDFVSAKDTFSRALVVSLSLSLPSAVGLYFLAQPVVEVLFERGRFTSVDTLNTAEILKLLALSLPFYGLSKTAVPLFYSLGKTIVPSLGSILAVLTNLTVILLTIKSLGIKGVALGTSFSLVLQCLFLLTVGAMILKNLPLRFLLKSLFTLGIALLALVGVLFLLKTLGLKSWSYLITAIPTGAVVFLGVCKVLGPEETYLFWVKLIRR
ncbi:murein biosynthesis integral membrane protein MurJ [Thermodesulfobacterium sp. TA1]|uniref:murein biosynthesis integral membrane protein MurJ n=1 Tax=Thermodesulfobacterium sp. TA1 TaxID=2234087 RepID=UPI001231D412|nr:murein biosynthesis integral membrane protein MurJ [Thermodesulfobacterium sp. TA1]QER42445.1 murein biosynthesis integral membrane protein MurJ [Thermodesulfobacterium sp. TA1]